MFLIVLVVAAVGTVLAQNSGVRNLAGEPDYRQVRLHWEAESSTVPKNGYSIRYCELQSWGTQRCRSQSVQTDQLPDNAIVDNETIKSFETDVTGLRMATTYSFEIKSMRDGGEREDRAEGADKSENVIVIPTKGFSARATQCLPHASEIEVSTGPFFGGRIAVEAADGERCAIDGKPHSGQEVYTLRINHAECGSHVNATTVATFVIVQENLPILTHSTRRFLVLCSYQPETLTVRAGINLPTNHQYNIGRGQAQMASIPYEEDNSIGRRSRNLRAGRRLQHPQALVSEEEMGASTLTQIRSENHFVPIFVMTMLVIAGLIGIVAIALKISRKRLVVEEFDNVSVASDVSTASSCSSITDLDIVCETKQPKRAASHN